MDECLPVCMYLCARVCSICVVEQTVKKGGRERAMQNKAHEISD